MAFLSRIYSAETVKPCRTLLSLTDFTIEQVAAAVGYNNAGRFASMFKKSTGVYPAEYRKMAQKK